MAGFKKVLVPVDFSGALAKLVPYVRALVGAGAEVHLLHICPDLQLFEGIYDLADMQNQYVAKAQGQMEAACAGMDQCPPAATAVACGDPAREIVAYAQREGMDLIVMATHGRKGLEHAILGSVAENVLRTSPVPVLTVNPHRLG